MARRLATKAATEYVERLEHILGQVEPNALEMRRLEKDIRASLANNTEPAECWAMLGTLRALAGKVSEFRECYLNAARLDNWTWSIRYNYGQALEMLGFFTESADTFGSLVDDFPDHAEVLFGALHSFLSVGRVDGVRAVRERIRKLQLDRPRSGALVTLVDAPEFQAFLGAVDQSGWPKDAFEKCVDASGDVIRKRGHRLIAYSIEVGCGGTVSLLQVVAASPEISAEISFEIAEELVDRNLDFVGGLMTISCASHEVI